MIRLLSNLRRQPAPAPTPPKSLAEYWDRVTANMPEPIARRILTNAADHTATCGFCSLMFFFDADNSSIHFGRAR